MTNTSLLKDYIRKSGLKLTYIAERLGVSRYTLYRKINGLMDFTQHEITAMCELLGIKDLETKEAIFFASVVD